MSPRAQQRSKSPHSPDIRQELSLVAVLMMVEGMGKKNSNYCWQGGRGRCLPCAGFLSRSHEDVNFVNLRPQAQIQFHSRPSARLLCFARHHYDCHFCLCSSHLYLRMARTHTNGFKLQDVRGTRNEAVYRIHRT